jgi:hypothetical protein
VGVYTMIKILAIGNSFSWDATSFLHSMAKHGDIDTKVVNLHIPGCSLAVHWENVLENRADYEYQLNGEFVKMGAIKETLLEENWNFITLQQGSGDSGFAETYNPYLLNLAEYIKEFVPKAKILVHQTWAYEIITENEAFANYGNDQQKMYEMICFAYQNAAKKLDAALIPCGDVIQTLRKRKEFDFANGGQTLCDIDGYHMHPFYGKYATAATWYESILGGNILENEYLPESEYSINPDLIQLIKQTVHEICNLEVL